jgi:hypothetical protein
VNVGLGQQGGVCIVSSADTELVVGPVRPGHATVYPCGETAPLASNVNFVAGQTVANAVDVAQTVCLTSSADTELVVDLMGWIIDESTR